MKINRVINGIAFVLSVCIILGILTFAHVCNGMEGMLPACHSTKVGAIVLSILVGSLSILIIFTKHKQLWYMFSLVRFVMSLAIVMLPVVIAPVCKMKTMHCYVYTRPFLMIIGAMLIGTQLISFITVKSLKGGINETLS